MVERSVRNCTTALTLIVFFFQAEDGIRDYKVTGVQTCALPISLRANLIRVASDQVGARTRFERELHAAVTIAPVGSEERRGGKEGRSRWAPDHLKKNTWQVLQTPTS